MNKHREHRNGPAGPQFDAEHGAEWGRRRHQGAPRPEFDAGFPRRGARGGGAFGPGPRRPEDHPGAPEWGDEEFGGPGFGADPRQGSPRFAQRGSGRHQPGFGPGFGPHRGGGPGWRGPRGRAGRGDVRAAILVLLAEEPMHGYQIIQEIASRSSGVWRPSPGAVYPALNLLQDEGLVDISNEGGRRLATLTDAGTTYMAEHADELGDPWQDAAGRGRHPRHELRARFEAVSAALSQVARTGDEDQVSQALDILDRARRDLYLVLAGPESGPQNLASPIQDAPVFDEPVADVPVADAPTPDAPAAE